MSEDAGTHVPAVPITSEGTSVTRSSPRDHFTAGVHLPCARAHGPIFRSPRNSAKVRH